MARAHASAAAASGCCLALLLALLAVQVQGHAMLFKPTPRNWLAYLDGKEWCPHCQNGDSASLRALLRRPAAAQPCPALPHAAMLRDAWGADRPAHPSARPSRSQVDGQRQREAALARRPPHAVWRGL
jgi:hypothetical protein